MRKYLLLITPLWLLLSVQTPAQTQTQSQDRVVDYPWVPRVSAYEAYSKFKNGKAIILHGGGEAFSRRHILGAINVDKKDREELLLKFPKSGIEIFTYCY